MQEALENKKKFKKIQMKRNKVYDKSKLYIK